MDTSAKRRKLAASMGNQFPSDTTPGLKSPAKRLLTHDDYGVENPFGTRSRVVGGERYPVRGNNNNNNPFGDAGAYPTQPELQQQQSAPFQRAREQRGDHQNMDKDRTEAVVGSTKEKQLRERTRDRTREQPTKSTSQQQQQQQQQQKPSREQSPRRSKADAGPSNRQKAPPRSRASDASPSRAAAAAERRTSKRDKVNSPLNTPTKRKKQKTGRKSSFADTARTPMEKELDALKEILNIERELMLDEIAALEEEILVYKTEGSLKFGGNKDSRKANAGKPLSSSASGGTDMDDLNSLIYNLLQINDKSLEEAVQKQKPSREQDVQEQLPSARPLHASSTLFHLEALSPLRFTNCTNGIEKLSSSGRTLRKQAFQGYSHEKLLYFDVLMMVDPHASPAPSVESIDLSISDWAKPELYGFLNACAPEKNICNILYSLGSYCDIARSRAMAWARIANTHPTLLRSMELQKQKQKTAEDQPGSREFGGLPRVQVVSYMPQQRLRLTPAPDPSQYDATEPELVITWLIEVDVSGEARSRISADVRTPETWVDENSIDVIRNIPNTFKALLKEKGVDGAIFSLIDILFGNGEDGKT